jgi:hypothetical protein
MDADEHAVLRSHLNRIAAAHRVAQAGDLGGAEALVRQAVAGIEPFGAGSPELLEYALWELAKVRRARCADADAEALMRRVVGAHDARHGHLGHAQSYVAVLAAVLEATGRGAEAADLYRRLARDLNRFPLRHHPTTTPGGERGRYAWMGRLTRARWTAAALDEHAALLRRLGRTAEARRAEARAARLRAGADARKRTHARAAPGQEAVYADLRALDQEPIDEGQAVGIEWTEFRPFFREGLRVVLFDERMRVEAVLGRHDPQGAYWPARPDWSTRQDLPPP